MPYCHRGESRVERSRVFVGISGFTEIPLASPSHDHGHRLAVYDGEVLVIAKKFDLLIGHPLDPLPAFPGKENAWD